MTRTRWILASLLALALTDCALTDDYAFAEAEATKADPPPPAGKGGATAGPGGAGGSAGMFVAGGVGGASGGTGGMTGKIAGPTTTAGVGGDPEAGKAEPPTECTPAPEICDGISNDCDDEIDEDADCPPGCTIATRDAHLYALCLFSDEHDWVTYEEATNACTKLAGQLDSKSSFALTWIESKDENDFLKTWIADTTPTSEEVMIWSGANDREKEQIWVWGQGRESKHFFTQSPDGGGKAEGAWFNDFPPDKPNSANDWNEDCGGFDSELEWQWNDFKCEDPRLGYVCEERK